jgi:hypothetical protein
MYQKRENYLGKHGKIKLYTMFKNLLVEGKRVRVRGKAEEYI